MSTKILGTFRIALRSRILCKVFSVIIFSPSCYEKKKKHCCVRTVNHIVPIPIAIRRRSIEVERH